MKPTERTYNKVYVRKLARAIQRSRIRAWKQTVRRTIDEQKKAKASDEG